MDTTMTDTTSTLTTSTSAIDLTKEMDAVLADTKPSTQDWLKNIKAPTIKKTLSADAQKMADEKAAKNGKKSASKAADTFAFVPSSDTSSVGQESREARHNRLAMAHYGWTLLGQIGTAQAEKVISGKAMVIADLTIDASDSKSGACCVCGGTHGADKTSGTISKARFGLTRVILSPNGKNAALLSDTCYSERMIGHLKTVKPSK